MSHSMPDYFLSNPEKRYKDVESLFKGDTVKLDNEKELDKAMSEAIRVFAMHPTTHKISQYEDIYWDNVEDVEEKFMDMFKRNETLKTISNLPDNVNRIVLINLSGGNTDSKGGGCGNIFKDWEFYYEKDFTNQKTFLDFVKLIYRMKGSKYDTWYELYGSFESHISESTLYIAVSFGHGS